MVHEFSSLADAHNFLQQGIGLDFVNGKKLIACHWQEEAEQCLGRFLFETEDGACFAQPFDECPVDEMDVAGSVITTINQTFLLGRYVCRVPNAYDFEASTNSIYGIRGFLARIQHKIEHDRKLTWCQGTKSAQSTISTFSQHPLSAFRDLSETILKLL